MGGRQNTTSTSTNQPYPGAKPLLDQGFGDALYQYKHGGLYKPNTMSTVVPWSSQTMFGMNGLQNLGMNNTGGKGLSGQYQSIINNGGFNNPQMAALSGIRSTATGNFNINEDPGFQQVMDKTRDTVNSNAGSLGRYGSGTHQGVMAQEIGDLGARQYQNWQGRKDAAQQNLFNAGQMGQQNLAGAYQGAQDAYNPLMKVGSMNEDLMGRHMNDALRINDDRMNAPYKNIQALLGIANGGSDYRSQTQTSQGPSNGFSNILGAGLGGASLMRGGKA